MYVTQAGNQEMFQLMSKTDSYTVFGMEVKNTGCIIRVVTHKNVEVESPTVFISDVFLVEDINAGKKLSKAVTGGTTGDFSFTAVTAAVVNSVVESDEVIYAWSIDKKEIQIDSNGEYQINGGDWTNQAGYVFYGDKVITRVTASASALTLVSTVLSVGAETSTFNVTTA